MWNSEMWRGMLGSETLPALLFFIIIFFIPESPKWLIVTGKMDRLLWFYARYILPRKM
jgi:hypothetical protein